MQRSINHYTLGGVITFIVVVLSAAASFLLSLQNIERESAHLTDGLIPWVEANRTYDVAMTSMLGSMQTYLVEYEASELKDAEAALEVADASLQELTRLEQSEALTAHAGADQLLTIQRSRNQIRSAAAIALATLGVLNRTATTNPEIFDTLENIEGDLEILHTSQLQLRTSSTNVASEGIANAFRQALVVGVVVSVLMTTLALVFYIVVQRRFAHPLSRLTQAAHAIGAGRYMTTVEHGGVAEIGQLQQSFQHMATLLSQRETASAKQFSELQEAHAKAQQAERHLTEQLQTIVEQREIIREMSVPLLPVGETMLVMPLIGSLDSERLDTMQSQALDRISRQRIDMLLVDVTGVPVIDSHVAQGLINMVRAARLLGTRVALVGIRPEVAQTIIGLGLDLSEVRTFASLQEGIRSSLHQSSGASPNLN